MIARYRTISESGVFGLCAGLFASCLLLADTAAAGEPGPSVSGRAVPVPRLVPETGYDPVTHALALGLTPEAMDARLDAGLKTAESCPMVFDTAVAIPHCWDGRVQVGS